MLKTKEVFGYTLQTGRDLFDDMAYLKSQEARSLLGMPNNHVQVIEAILEGLDLAGVDVDNLDLDSVMAPTVEQDEPEQDFVVDANSALHEAARHIIPTNSVHKCLQSFIISKHIQSDILMNAPFDTAVHQYNEAMKERIRQSRR